MFNCSWCLQLQFLSNRLSDFLVVVSVPCCLISFWSRGRDQNEIKHSLDFQALNVLQCAIKKQMYGMHLRHSLYSYLTQLNNLFYKCAEYFSKLWWFSWNSLFLCHISFLYFLSVWKPADWLFLLMILEKSAFCELLCFVRPIYK